MSRLLEKLEGKRYADEIDRLTHELAAAKETIEGLRNALMLCRGAAQCAKQGITVVWDALISEIDAAIAEKE